MNFKSKIERFNQHLWDYHFIVPENISNYFLNQCNTRRVVCFINEKLKIHCALISDGLGQYYITFNKENRKKLGVDLGDILSITIEEDKSKYGIPCPDEIKELFDLDPEGADLFHSLTIGKQRSLLHLVNKIKSSDIRIRKSLTILEYLKENNGQLDFRELNEAFKMSNSRF